MIQSILIANRGEIARRVIHSAKRLGIRTVAVYAEDDRHSLHVEEADTAYLLKGDSAAQTYLNGEKLIALCQTHGIQAIHPGYGFLSENAGFAGQCEEAGIIFIGPDARAIEAMGVKDRAKARMQAAGVSVIPGYHGSDQSEETLLQEARKIGFPVLLKASAGGGGKGMRVVHAESGFSEALEMAQREAQAAFGSRHMLIEKYLLAPRHVEVQILFDHQGQGLALGDRDCSLQRRHQKVLEEAPAPGLEQATRERLYVEALRCGEAIGYRNAGTIEFLVDSEGGVWFMEMNTRLQVEHPVTELVCGLDLVEWQIRIASGEGVPEWNTTRIHGHAIEARLCAENPDHDFLPQSGLIETLSLPPNQPFWGRLEGLPQGHLERHSPDQPERRGAGDNVGPHVRCDFGYRSGDLLSLRYDPMLGKLIVWGKDREEARLGLIQALAQTRLAGFHWNRDFLIRCLKHPDFARVALSTHFLQDHAADLHQSGNAEDWIDLAAAWLLYAQPVAKDSARPVEVEDSPWHRLSNWRLNGHCEWQCRLLRNEDPETLDLTLNPQGIWHSGRWPGQGFVIEPVVIDQAPDQNPGQILGHIKLACGESSQSLAYYHSEDSLWLWSDSQSVSYQRPSDEPGAQDGHVSDPGQLTAPMTGAISRLMVEPGQAVAAETTLLVMEAMKMELPIKSSIAGVVKAVHCQVGQQVDMQQLLVELETQDTNE